MVLDDQLEIQILDEDHDFARSVAVLLKSAGYLPYVAESFNDATRRHQQKPCQLLLLGIAADCTLDLRQMKALVRAMSGARIIAMIPEALEGYEEALREQGVGQIVGRTASARQAFQYVQAQADLCMLESQNYRLRQMLDGRTAYENLIGASAPMRALYRLLDQVARTDTPVLVTGETGTERLEVAQAIHSKSERALHPSVVIDCARGSEDAQGIFLFGPRGGGSYGDGPTVAGSAFARAGKGTLILQNVEQLGSIAQQRLLEFMHRPFFQNETPGSPQPICRILATAGPNMMARVDAGEFLRELYYRMNILQVRIPALRERREDIPMLAQHFLRTMARREGEGVGAKSLTFSSRAMLGLFQHDWPGNLDELSALVCELARNAQGQQIEAEDLPPHLQQRVVQSESPAAGESAVPGYDMPLKDAKRVFETEYFTSLLRRTRGNMTMASRQSRVGRPYLYKKIREYGIEPESYR